MDNLELQTASQSDPSQLQAQCDSLRQLVISMLVLLLVISAAFNLFLLRQVTWNRKDLQSMRIQAAPMLEDYRTLGPVMDDFLKKVTDYGRAHPDFTPIMQKYGLDKIPATPPAAASAGKAKK